MSQRKNKTVYSYHPETKVFLCLDYAFESPLEPDIYHHPAYSTTKAPQGELKENEVFIFNEEAQEWEVKPDFSEEIWIDPEKGEAVPVRPGEPLPEGVVNLKEILKGQNQ